MASKRLRWQSGLKKSKRPTRVDIEFMSTQIGRTPPRKPELFFTPAANEGYGKHRN